MFEAMALEVKMNEAFKVVDKSKLKRDYLHD